MEVAVAVAGEGLGPTKHTAVSFKRDENPVTDENVGGDRGNSSKQSSSSSDGRFLSGKLRTGRIKKPPKNLPR